MTVEPKFFYARSKSRTEGEKVFRGKPILCVAYKILGRTIEFGFAIPNPKLPLSRPQIRKVALTRLTSGKASERDGSCGGTHWLHLNSAPSPEEAIQAIRTELLQMDDHIISRVLRQMKAAQEVSEQIEHDTDPPPPSYRDLEMYPPVFGRFGAHY